MHETFFGGQGTFVPNIEIMFEWFNSGIKPLDMQGIVCSAYPLSVEMNRDTMQ